jgi:hypothetical protein
MTIRGVTTLARADAILCEDTRDRKSPAYRQIVESLFHSWIAMGLAAGALVLARRRALGPLPSILRLISGALLPVLVILTVLGLLIWSPFWEFLRPFGVIEKDVRPGATSALLRNDPPMLAKNDPPGI